VRVVSLPVTIKVSDDTVRMLDELAMVAGVSVSEVVREALSEELDSGVPVPAGPHVIGTRLDDDTAAALRDEAAEAGVSVAFCARARLGAYLEHLEALGNGEPGYLDARDTGADLGVLADGVAQVLRRVVETMEHYAPTSPAVELAIVSHRSVMLRCGHRADPPLPTRCLRCGARARGPLGSQPGLSADSIGRILRQWSRRGRRLG